MARQMEGPHFRAHSHGWVAGVDCGWEASAPSCHHLPMELQCLHAVTPHVLWSKC